jgi:shikimate kinase
MKYALLEYHGKSNICLYGPPGSGKSYISKLLGKELDMEVYDIDDDHLEKNWGKSVAEKLEELGDDKFIQAEAEETMKVDKNNTILSLTGSNALHEETMQFMKNNGIVIYLDLDKEEILKRSESMKINRIVGQKTKSLSEILDFRKEIYQRYYDYRIIVGNEDSAEVTVKYIIHLLNRSEIYVSTRGDISNDDFYKVLNKGLASDVGLYVPQYIPKFSISQFKRLINMSFRER